jgi:hypothetical protein
VAFSVKMKSKNDDIVVGIFYEMPDGRIVKTFGFNNIDKTVSYYLDDDKGTRLVPFYEIKTKWKPRRDLRDFPNARDPRLPYVFDLFWDIKHISQLKRAIEEGHEYLDEIKEKMLEHGIEL